MSQVVIFTDLDGTLLNHDNYDYDCVCPLISKLKDMNIPVVLNSSKTLSELEEWQVKLGLDTPMIAENGGIICMPVSMQCKSNRILIGRPYDEIRTYIKHLRKRNGWKFEGFGDWTVSEVMNHTKLHTKEAVLATEREVTEPIIWQDSDLNLEAFKKELAKEKLMLKKGGRFYHVMGRHDKADAMQFLLNKEYFSSGHDCLVVALGDSDNDVSMLNYADIPVVMPNASGKNLNIANAIYSEMPAPNGWVNAIEEILKSEHFTTQIKGVL